jgi:hypothetical protein
MGVRQAAAQSLHARLACTPRKLLSVVSLLSPILLGPAMASAGEGLPSVESVVTHMAQARLENRTRLRPYTVTRNYKLIGKEKQTTRSEVIAELSFIPPDAKQFVIREATGMGLGERIVRQMLEHETAIVKNYGSTDMSPANYEFRMAGEDVWEGHPCYVLEMLPRRKDKILLRGKIWVDATTYLLRRTEGEPGKAPSWWLRDSRIVLIYGDVAGMWLQISSESTADVRFLGTHTMISRDVKYKTGELVAATGADVRFGR